MISEIISPGGLLKFSAVALFAVLLLAGCGQATAGSDEAEAAGSTSSPTASATPATEPEPTATPSPKPTSYLETVKDPYRGLDPEVGEVFVDLAVEGDPTLGSKDIGTMVDLALDLCAIYGRGGTENEVLDRMKPKPGTNYNIVQSLTIEAAGIATFCPEYTEVSKSS